MSGFLFSRPFNKDPAVTDDLESTLDLIRDQAARVFAKGATPEYLKSLLEHPGSFDQLHWNEAIEQVWPAISLPEEVGGVGIGWRGLCVLAEEAGAKTVSLPLIGAAVAADCLLKSANIDKHALISLLASGERVACLAFAEPGEGGLSLTPRTSLEGTLLTGCKAVTPFAAKADLALVHAHEKGELVLTLVALDQPGVTRKPVASLDNARAAATLVFDGAHAVRLELQDARATFADAIHLAALVTAFEQIGGARACLMMARDYALERVAFGQPIGRFQAIKHKLADMYSRIEVARGCALDALQAVDSNQAPWGVLCAAARLGAIDAYDFSSRENIQVHGGFGVTWEAMPHHYYRRSRSLALELGSSPFWRDQLLQLAGFDTFDAQGDQA